MTNQTTPRPLPSLATSTPLPRPIALPSDHCGFYSPIFDDAPAREPDPPTHGEIHPERDPDWVNVGAALLLVLAAVLVVATSLNIVFSLAQMWILP